METVLRTAHFGTSIKAIGVRVKIIYERSLFRETDGFFRTLRFRSVQKLSHFEVRKFSRISYEKYENIEI